MGSELQKRHEKMSVQGTISRMSLTNFMQYASVTLEPGPNLNVIIGPNGSGKSAIVNAICLGLAGKYVHSADYNRLRGAKEALFLIASFDTPSVQILIFCLNLW